MQFFGYHLIMKYQIFNAICSRRWVLADDALASFDKKTDALSVMLDAAIHGSERDEAKVTALLSRSGTVQEDRPQTEIFGDVAVLHIKGVLFPRANLISSASGLSSVETLAKAYQSTVDAPKIRSTILYIDSPGGNADLIQEFAQQIYESRAIHNVVTFYSNRGASGGYWIGSSAGKSYAAESASVGSIGVRAVVEIESEKENVKSYRYISSQSPKKISDPGTKDGDAEIQTEIDDLAAIFVSNVARNMGVSEETVLNKFGGGSVLIAKKAQTAGMIHGVTTLPALIKSLQSGEQEMASEPVKSPQITRAFLNDNHTEIVSAIKIEAVTGERKRISALTKIAGAGFHAELKGAIDAGTSQGDFAEKILLLEREKGPKANLDNINSDVENSGGTNVDDAPIKQNESHDERELALKDMGV